jgi:3-oxoacyl-[acyl-carrier-protein] synthase-3
MSVRAKITGTGMYVPDRVVANSDLVDLMETSDEWIQQRTGIRERRWARDDEQPVHLAHAAAVQALDAAGLAPTDLDLILLATLSPQASFPGTSFFLHEALDLADTPCLDVRAQCSGFLFALDFADSMIRSEKYQRILVVGCELHSTGIDISTRGRDVAVLFGDGAGAVVVEANRDENDPAGLLALRLHSEGRYARKLWLEAPGSGFHPVRISKEMIDDGRAFPQMEGRFVFKHAVTRMPEVLRETMAAAEVQLEEVDLFLFHQANLRINEFVTQKLQIPEEKVLSNIQRYGNCSAGSIPMLLAEAGREGLLRPGTLVSMTAFGSGFTWASAMLRW